MKTLAGGLSIALALLWVAPSAGDQLPTGSRALYYIPAPPRDDPDSVDGEVPPEDDGVTDPEGDGGDELPPEE